MTAIDASFSEHETTEFIALDQEKYKERDNLIASYGNKKNEGDC